MILGPWPAVAWIAVLLVLTAPLVPSAPHAAVVVVASRDSSVSGSAGSEAERQRPRSLQPETAAPVSESSQQHVAGVDASAAADWGQSPRESRQQQKLLRRSLKRTKTFRNKGLLGGATKTYAEALAAVGDGRIHVEGIPVQKPKSYTKKKLQHTEIMALLGNSNEPSSPSAGLSSQRVTPAQAPAPITVTVTAKNNNLNFDISPLIYGVNEYSYPSNAVMQAEVADAGIQYVRRGGDRDSRYNWLYDTRNLASDYYFINDPLAQDGSMTSSDLFVQYVKAAGAEPLFQIPALGMLPKGRNSNCSFSVRKYGRQQSTLPGNEDCGNGVLQNGTTIQWNDLSDAAAPFGPSHQNRFVQITATKWGSAASGGLQFYALDNEPVWWSYAHRDIEKQASSYDSILQRHMAIAAAIRSADPTAQITGPVCAGWSDSFYSATDFQAGWGTRPWTYWGNPVDRRAHGNVPFLEWYLGKFAAYKNASGTQLLDIVDVHAYMAGDYGDDATDATSQAARIATTRSLWDPAFNCSGSLCTWVDPPTAPDGVPQFLVRVQEAIKSAYPGLPLAVTEYNFGGNNDISGAVAQAEALGIFGRLRVKMASTFPGARNGTSVYQAFKMYGNYDGKGAGFGNRGVSAVSSSYTTVSSYAAIDTQRNVLTVLIVVLSPSSQTVQLKLSDVSPTKPIKYFRYSSSNLKAIVAMPSFAASANLQTTFPGYSLNMLEVSLS